MKTKLPQVLMGIAGGLALQTQVYGQNELAMTEPQLFEHTQAGDDLLAELSENERELNSSNAAKSIDLKINASKIYIDLKNEREVDFTALTGWATNFVWKFGDGSSISGFRHVKHDFKKAGKYEITLLASDNEHLAREVIEVEVVDNSSPLELQEMEHYIVFPSDNKLQADIQLRLPQREKNLLLEVKNIEGERVFEYKIGRVKKSQKIHVDLKNLDAGKYYTVLKGKKYSLVSRLTVAR